MATILVYGASSAAIDKKYVDDARELGRLMAERGHQCINGGGATGVMGAVTDGALDAGGRVQGIIPKFMVDNGWCYDRLEDVLITADMHQRKSLMAEQSQAVIALPGGVGTLEELLEAITWRQLGIDRKPIVLLNTAGFFDHLLAMFSHCAEEGFMRKSHTQELWQVASSPSEALDMVERSL